MCSVYSWNHPSILIEVEPKQSYIGSRKVCFLLLTMPYPLSPHNSLLSTVAILIQSLKLQKKKLQVHIQYSDGHVQKEATYYKSSFICYCYENIKNMYVSVAIIVQL